MSLINQLLQDLERRRASGAETRSLSRRVRALPNRARRGSLIAAALLGVAAAAAIGLSAYFRLSEPPPPRAEVAPSAPTPKPVTVVAPAAAPVAAAPAEEVLVRDALTVPVFQLAEDLQFTPPSPSVKPSTPKKKTAPKAAAAPRKPAIAAAPAEPQEKPPPAQAAAAAAPSSTRAAASNVEEVVIPDTPSPVPVEKQMREPTAYERAELEFRDAVARLRQGRVVDAEAGFRAALKEDRSHAAARQVLIGLLIDSARNNDAEDVLREALAFNPRQPRHAMLLARLELERGDAASAAKTLEAVRHYAGVDADYFAFLAAVYQRLGRHQEAAELYANALTVAPANAVWMMGLGISLQALQRTEDARTAFRSAAASKTLNADLQAFVESRLRELSTSKR